MSLTAADLDDAWDIWDLTETVTYYPYIGATDTVSLSGTEVQALGRAIHDEEDATAEDGSVHVRTRRWHLRKSVLDAAGVQVTHRGEFTQASGARWVVADGRPVETVAAETRYAFDAHRI